MLSPNENDKNPYENLKEESSHQNGLPPPHPSLDSTASIPEKPVDDYGFILHNTGSADMIVFFGPPGVGKTVAVMRLLTYLETLNYTYSLSNATPNTGYFKSVKERFLSTMREMGGNKPPRTTGLDFLLIDVRNKGKLQFHLLEAPGEHFFTSQDPSRSDYPTYMGQIFSSQQRKLYVIFFEENLFSSPDMRRHYSDRLAGLINNHVDLNKDKLVLVYNKINNNPNRMSGSKVNVEELKQEIFDSVDYQSFANAIRENHGKIKHIPLVPYFSGQFNSSQTWSPSPQRYPQSLFSTIYNQLNKSWLNFFR